MATCLLINALKQSSSILAKIKPTNLEFVRFKAKKAIGSTQNAGNSHPKHRCAKKFHGEKVESGQILATQRRLRFHPGLNVKFGRNGTLNAAERGTVMVTCELAKPKWSRTWAQQQYEGREDPYYKKFFHVIPEPQHHRFKCIAAV